jgi:putative transposase
MKRSGFTEAQIIAVLRVQAASAEAADMARKHGISEATLYNWKAKYGGLDVAEARRLKRLEEESARLKKLLAGLSSASSQTKPTTRTACDGCSPRATPRP